MLLVADNLTVTTPAVASALTERDADTVRGLVHQMERAGADLLDLNLGFDRRRGPATASWLVRVVAAETGLPLVLDTAEPETMRAGLETAAELALSPTPIVNSVSLDPEKAEVLLPLAAAFGAAVVGYCVRGAVPQSPEERLEEALALVALTDAAGVPRERVSLDPILFPLVKAQADLANVLAFFRHLPALLEPPVRTMAALSNASWGVAPARRWAVEGTLLGMLAGLQVDAVLLDVLDPRLRAMARVLKAVQQDEVFADTAEGDG